MKDSESSKELLQELLDVAIQFAGTCQNCYGRGKRKHTFTLQEVDCTACAAARAAIARAADEPEVGRFGIDAAKIKPVPQEDVERLRMAVREKVVEPMLARSLQRLLDEQEARMRPLGAVAAQPPDVVRVGDDVAVAHWGETAKVVQIQVFLANGDVLTVADGRTVSTKCAGDACEHCEPEHGCKPTSQGE
jgi:hypothetical protein